MAEYEVSRSMPAPREVAYDVAAVVERMEAWLPTTVDVKQIAPNVLEVEGETKSGSYDSQGLYRAQPEQLRLEWGSRGTDDYSGWLQFADSGAGASEATMHLSFRGNQPQASGGGDAAAKTESEMAEALSRLADEVQRRVTDAS